MKTKMFHVFLTINPHFEEQENQPRKYAGTVIAENLEQAFVKAQNLERHWNPDKPCRSASIGDVIQENDKSYLVCGIGFRELV